MGLRWRFIEGHTFAVPRCALTCHASGPPTASAQFHYKGFPTFVKKKSIVVNRAAIDHEIRLLFFPNITA